MCRALCSTRCTRWNGFQDNRCIFCNKNCIWNWGYRDEWDTVPILGYIIGFWERWTHKQSLQNNIINYKTEIYLVHRVGTMYLLGFWGEFTEETTPEANLAEQVRITKEDRMGIPGWVWDSRSKWRHETADFGGGGTINDSIFSKCKPWVLARHETCILLIVI